MAHIDLTAKQALPMQEQDEFARAVQAHDMALRARGHTIWLGAEPTFTDRWSHQPEWLNEALGEDKWEHAGRVAARLAEQPGVLFMRSVGRQYEDEPCPRWSFGLYQRRDGESVWQGPPDPLIIAGEAQAGDPVAFQMALLQTLQQQGWHAAVFEGSDPLPLRILCAETPLPPIDPEREPELAAASVHTCKTPIEGLSDSLARRGWLLFKLGLQDGVVCLELPPFPDVGTFLGFVRLVQQAALGSGVTQLIWQGHPPPVNDQVAWATLTPDPAVLEINMAPAAGIGEFLADMRRVFAATQAEGLSPERFQYNGQAGDSGGGGQFTVGGPQPLSSPFITRPQTLPRLIRYLVAHPALSYWFAPAYVGASSQSPRPDEGVRDNFFELGLALKQLAAKSEPDAEFIWRSLNNFLVDPSGNSHRSELNIEKLWNPYLPQRGCLGLVEFRAFRMLPSAERSVAVALLLRSLLAMLAEQDVMPELVDWGEVLHRRFALPFYLRSDLQQVLADLDAAELGLEPLLAEQLLLDPERELAQARFEGGFLRIEQALDFWPLLGDTAMQASGDSRLVDASTQRLQLSLHAEAGSEQVLDDWSLWIEGCQLPLRAERDAQGEVRLFGVRYRNFEPAQGLHPGVAARSVLTMQLWNAARGQGLRLSWHEWRPQGGGYDGLPADAEVARERRQERLVIEPIDSLQGPKLASLPQGALDDYCLDLRYL